MLITPGGGIQCKLQDGMRSSDPATTTCHYAYPRQPQVVSIAYH